MAIWFTANSICQYIHVNFGGSAGKSLLYYLHEAASVLSQFKSSVFNILEQGIQLEIICARFVHYLLV